MLPRVGKIPGSLRWQTTPLRTFITNQEFQSFAWARASLCVLARCRRLIILTYSSIWETRQKLFVLIARRSIDTIRPCKDMPTPLHVNTIRNT